MRFASGASHDTNAYNPDAVADTGAARIGIADGCPILVDALRDAIAVDPSMVVTCTASTFDEVLRCAAHVDLLVIDPRSLGVAATEAVAQIRDLSPHPRMLLFVERTQHARVRRYLDLGADGVLEKSADTEDFRVAVRTVAAGHRLVASYQRRTDEPGALTPAELTVLTLVAEGGSVEAVAAVLFLSRNTIKTHLRNIHAKLGADNRTAAVVKAIRLGILD